MKACILLCAVFCLGVAKADWTNVTGIDWGNVTLTDWTNVTLSDLESDCKHQAYLGTLDCSVKIGSGTEDVECLTDVIINYVECKHNTNEEGTIENRFSDFGAPIEKSTTEIVKCVLDNVLDMMKCVVNDQLTGDMKWKWSVLTKCVYKYLPTFLACTL
ncbi:uncharacterized protein LOC118277545 isoform X2 [Spodoptera frugiperda]|uniref:Uncharacterized protein LOC118277545 isoform X2 n=1 Tax=Spodoptera frugiperda TaxID=7108 RepID=A0A9R0DGC2_SPOFR|nr:uncharacterized protein LOC118277545 isoform X2 [Spodoptera frugiperda]